MLLTRANNEKADKSRRTTELIGSLNSACDRFIISLGESNWLRLLMAKTLKPHLSIFSYQEYKVTVCNACHMYSSDKPTNYLQTPHLHHSAHIL